jgi:hypothetical protein
MAGIKMNVIPHLDSRKLLNKPFPPSPPPPRKNKKNKKKWGILVIYIIQINKYYLKICNGVYWLVFCTPVYPVHLRKNFQISLSAISLTKCAPKKPSSSTRFFR